MIVTVFGSSIPKEGDKEFEIAFRLGNRLGEAGISVCTGGYQGIMNAVSKGAANYNVEIIGVLVDLFGAKPSEYLTKIITCHSLFDRLEKLISTGNAYIVLAGGTGTMVELSLIWEMMNKNLIPEKPIACVGEMWNKIVAEMENRIMLEKRKTGLVKCFNDSDNCADYVIDSLKK